MHRLGTRAMSPLIATVLLMAFAVALGGMIMNMTGDGFLGSTSVDCSAVELDFTQFCYDGQAVKVRVRSTGEEMVSGFILRVDDPQTGIIEIKTPAIELRKGQADERRFPIVISGETKFSVFAQVSDHGESLTCPLPSTTKTQIPTC